MKKWLRVLFVTCALVLTGTCITLAYVSESRGGYAPLCAEEESSEVIEESSEPEEEPVVEEEQPVVVEEGQEEAKESWVENKFNTFVVPLLSGVSITSVVSALVCILMTLLKNRSLDKKLLEVNKEAEKRKAEADDVYKKANDKLLEVTEVLKLIREVSKDVAEDNALNREVKEYVKKSLSSMLSMIEENNKEVVKIEKIKSVLAILVQLEAKVAKQSSEVIKSGIIEDINKLTMLIGEM